jgi:hypothetical protein
VDQLAGLVENMTALTEQFRLAAEGFTTADLASTVRMDEIDVRLVSLTDRLTALETAAPVDMLHLDGLETITVSGLATFNGGLKVDRIASLGDLTLFESDVQFIGRPYFDHDSGGFAVIAEGTQGIRVTFERAYVAQPVVNAMISLETPDPVDGVTDAALQAVLNAKAQEIFSSDVRFLITDKNREGFTILLNKSAPFDLRFSWIALAVKDAKTFLAAPEDITSVTPEPPLLLNWPTSDPATQAWEQTGASAEVTTPPVTTEPDPVVPTTTETAPPTVETVPVAADPGVPVVTDPEPILTEPVPDTTSQEPPVAEPAPVAAPPEPAPAPVSPADPATP